LKLPNLPLLQNLPLRRQSPFGPVGRIFPHRKFAKRWTPRWRVARLFTLSVWTCLFIGHGVCGADWNIVWSDEFNGSAINSANWQFEIGNNSGWGNNELEYYTSRPQNAYVTNGLLHLVAQKESYLGFNYTSARIKSQALFAKQYGRFEFRARLPAGLGYWPALWMLGADISSVGWPACGEIDVLEAKGAVPTQVQGSIHYSDASNHRLSSTAVYTLPGGGSVTNFHSYLLEWSTNSIRWYVDSLLYGTQTNWSSSTGPYPAPFSQPFFLIMNLAVGGNYLSNPTPSDINSNTPFPGEVQVDYVRVYDLTAPLAITPTRSTNGVILSWPTNIVCHLQGQTNGAGISTNWADVPAASNPFLVPFSAVQGGAFYRLVSP
jgi:beta-glucanase (GH16 family)